MLRDIMRAGLVMLVIAFARGDLRMPRQSEPAPPVVETPAPRPWQPVAPPVAPEPPPMPQQWINQSGRQPMPAVQWQPPAVSWQPPQIVIQEETKRPLRRVATAMTDLGDALIGVIR